jgi:4-hydroxybenzoyl-CoA thioesterase
VPFLHELKVRVPEVDRLGMVFYGRVAEYCNAALEELFDRFWGDDRVAVFERGGWGMTVVRLEVEYARPMRLGERLVVGIEVDRLGQKSVTLVFTVRGASDGEVRAISRQVWVVVDLQSHATRSIPEELRAGFERFGLLPPSPIETAST